MDEYAMLGMLLDTKSISQGTTIQIPIKESCATMCRCQQGVGAFRVHCQCSRLSEDG